MKHVAIVIQARIDGIEQLDAKDCALAQRIEGISACRVQPRLQIKGENSTRGGVNGLEARGLAESGSGEQTGETQDRNRKTLHGLGES